MDTSGTDHPRHDALRQLPAVDALLSDAAIAQLTNDHPRSEVVRAVRQVLDDCRSAIQRGATPDTDPRQLALAVRTALHARARPSLRRVINATGIVLHTGLGRAPLAAEAIDALADTAAGWCNLELNLRTGARGRRQDHLRSLLCELTGAADALVVNNNAAATFLTLNTLAAGHEVIISRGQLVEIGGSYRLPDIMAAAACRMVEVGTTNRTRVGDYERAVTAQTRALLRVHTSNYRIQGFTESARLTDLVALSRKYAPQPVAVVDDLGSGLLTRDLPWPAPGDDETPGPAAWDEPTVRDSIADGADLTLFSGDKLLGGPQAGIVVGRADLIADLRRNPLMRAFRPGKLTLAALEATLRLYRDPAALLRRLPVYQLLGTPPSTLQARARRLAAELRELATGTHVEVVADTSYAGGGTLPTLPFPTHVVMVRLEGPTPERLAGALRGLDVPVITRIQHEAVVFDCRTLADEDVDAVAAAVAEVIRDLA